MDSDQHNLVGKVRPKKHRHWQLTPEEIEFYIHIVYKPKDKDLATYENQFFDRFEWVPTKNRAKALAQAMRADPLPGCEEFFSRRWAPGPARNLEQVETALAKSKFSHSQSKVQIITQARLEWQRYKLESHVLDLRQKPWLKHRQDVERDAQEAAEKAKEITTEEQAAENEAQSPSTSLDLSHQQLFSMVVTPSQMSSKVVIPGPIRYKIDTVIFIDVLHNEQLARRKEGQACIHDWQHYNREFETRFTCKAPNLAWLITVVRLLDRHPLFPYRNAGKTWSLTVPALNMPPIPRFSSTQFAKDFLTWELLPIEEQDSQATQAWERYLERANGAEILYLHPQYSQRSSPPTISIAPPPQRQAQNFAGRRRGEKPMLRNLLVRRHQEAVAPQFSNPMLGQSDHQSKQTSFQIAQTEGTPMSTIPQQIVPQPQKPQFTDHDWSKMMDSPEPPAEPDFAWYSYGMVDMTEEFLEEPPQIPFVSTAQAEFIDESGKRRRAARRARDAIEDNIYSGGW